MNAPSETALLITSSDQREADRRLGHPMGCFADYDFCDTNQAEFDRRTKLAERAAPSVDLLDLYETIGTAATTINVAADSIYAAHLMGQKPWLPMTDAKAAAERVLAALDEYEREMG